MQELAPYFHYVNNAYGRWLNEDRASTGFDDNALLKPMTLEAFKTSGILRILTPGQAIDMFNEMLAKAPVEHFMMMLPPGIPPSKFAPYAEVFAREVIPAFRCASQFSPHRGHHLAHEQAATGGPDSG